MPAQNDTTNLGYIMDSLKRDVDEYFTRAPLRLVMELPDARTALATAGEFYGTLRAVFAGSHQQRVADRPGRGLPQRVAGLAGVQLHLPPDATASRLAACSTASSRAWVRWPTRCSSMISSSTAAASATWPTPCRPRPTTSTATRKSGSQRDRQDFADEATRATQSFVERCQRFSDAVTGGATVEQLRPEIMHLYEHYKQVYAFISQCGGHERSRLAENARRAKAALVDLRTQLEI